MEQTNKRTVVAVGGHDAYNHAEAGVALHMLISAYADKGAPSEIRGKIGAFLERLAEDAETVDDVRARLLDHKDTVGQLLDEYGATKARPTLAGARGMGALFAAMAAAGSVGGAPGLPWPTVGRGHRPGEARFDRTYEEQAARQAKAEAKRARKAGR